MPTMKFYVGIWAGLVAATVMEVVTRSIPGAFAVVSVIILLISSGKAVTIAMYFQHLRYENKSLAILPIAAVIAVVILAVAAWMSM
ncbi:MAG TPA: cytochrome C oxidase subunit IV family protein [Candidatus Limnocylindrales bacterium]|nr:cytochrome C oxidase subunit IV family protein [Candidatus Limnocylindrales bacterium]